VWPDWSYADADGTFGNRFDDSHGLYRVLYASTQRIATFVECLAYFRPDPEVLAEYAVIVGDDDDDEPPPPGHVPSEWLDARCMGEATLVGEYVDLGHHETLAELRRALAARIVHHGLDDFDAATIRLTAPRAFTQDISRHVFDETADGTRRWNGIAYRSRHGDDLENWAIFEPAAPGAGRVEQLNDGDPDLEAALLRRGRSSTGRPGGLVCSRSAGRIPGCERPRNRRRVGFRAVVGLSVGAD
jgi:hypothetical protein